jgi:hypothetical protein
MRLAGYRNDCAGQFVDVFAPIAVESERGRPSRRYCRCSRFSRRRRCSNNSNWRCSRRRYTDVWRSRRYRWSRYSRCGCTSCSCCRRSRRNGTAPATRCVVTCQASRIIGDAGAFCGRLVRQRGVRKHRGQYNGGADCRTTHSLSPWLDCLTIPCARARRQRCGTKVSSCHGRTAAHCGDNR